MGTQCTGQPETIEVIGATEVDSQTETDLQEPETIEVVEETEVESQVETDLQELNVVVEDAVVEQAAVSLEGSSPDDGGNVATTTTTIPIAIADLELYSAAVTTQTHERIVTQLDDHDCYQLTATL